jgi:radical SAM superfamily enzyme YgiQ (UPF0313 family)
MIGRKKKIVLYYPQQASPRSGVPYSKDVLPISLLTIAGWPLADGYEVEIIDGGLYPQDEAHRRVLEACEGALLCGTSAMLGYQVADGYLCSRKIKARYPALPLVLGGWFPSSAPELMLATGLFDAVALGQGEITFRELVRAIDAGEPIEDIAGLALWRDGQVVKTAARFAVGWGEIPDVPWQLLDFEPYREQQLRQRSGREWECLPHPPDARSPARKKPFVGISYYSSFGCPLACTFCCSPAVSGLRWKSMPAERMLDDLQELQQRWGFDVVRFYDANYGVMEKRVKAFAQGIVEREMKLWHYVYMQSESVACYDPSTLDLMAQSGMYAVLLGAETGTDATMEMIKKTTRGDENIQAAVALHERGIVPQMTYIIGFPGESAASMEATLEQARRIQVACPRSNTAVWPYRPIPGTPLFDAAVALGYEPPRTLEEWGEIGDYRQHETWQGKIPPDVARRRKLFDHFTTLSKGLARGKIGWWEERALDRLRRGDYRFGIYEAKAFDLYHRLGRTLASRGPRRAGAAAAI